MKKFLLLLIIHAASIVCSANDLSALEILHFGMPITAMTLDQLIEQLPEIPTLVALSATAHVRNQSPATQLRFLSNPKNVPHDLVPAVTKAILQQTIAMHCISKIDSQTIAPHCPAGHDYLNPNLWVDQDQLTHYSKGITQAYRSWLAPALLVPLSKILYRIVKHKYCRHPIINYDQDQAFLICGHLAATLAYENALSQDAHQAVSTTIIRAARAHSLYYKCYHAEKQLIAKDPSLINKVEMLGEILHADKATKKRLFRNLFHELFEKEINKLKRTL